MVTFLLPIFLLSIHAFSNHKHGVCISKVENHLHEKDIDCKLHLIKLNDSFLTKNNFNIKLPTTISTYSGLEYNFLKSHYQLSFSLRGPPQKT